MRGSFVCAVAAAQNEETGHDNEECDYSCYYGHICTPCRKLIFLHDISRIFKEESVSNPYAAPESVLTSPHVATGIYQPRIFSLHGRIGRLRYIAYSWLTSVVATIAAFALIALLSAVSAASGEIAAILTWVAYFPVIAAGVIMAKRRLNDMDKSGWLALLIFVPVVNVFFGLFLMLKGGTQGANRFGPAPAQNPRSIVILAWLLPIVVLLGIIAAVAIPTYQESTVRERNVI